MLKVYIAGPYSGPDVLSVLGNMRRGMQLSTEVFRAGFAPFVPWHDYHFALADDFPMEYFKDASMAWLEASDAVLVQTHGYEKSNGTMVEIARATILNKPVFYTLQSLIEWGNKHERR